ncbi:hypothetical protein QJQ45_018523, partial [Haematococcus lacustris]
PSINWQLRSTAASECRVKGGGTRAGCAPFRMQTCWPAVGVSSYVAQAHILAMILPTTPPLYFKPLVGGREHMCECTRTLNLLGLRLAALVQCCLLSICALAAAQSGATATTLATTDVRPPWMPGDSQHSAVPPLRLSVQQLLLLCGCLLLQSCWLRLFKVTTQRWQCWWQQYLQRQQHQAPEPQPQPSTAATGDISRGTTVAAALPPQAVPPASTFITHSPDPTQRTAQRTMAAAFAPPRQPRPSAAVVLAVAVAECQGAHRPDLGDPGERTPGSLEVVAPASPPPVPVAAPVPALPHIQLQRALTKAVPHVLVLPGLLTASASSLTSPQPLQLHKLPSSSEGAVRPVPRTRHPPPPPSPPARGAAAAAAAVAAAVGQSPAQIRQSPAAAAVRDSISSSSPSPVPQCAVPEQQQQQQGTPLVAQGRLCACE